MPQGLEKSTNNTLILRLADESILCEIIKFARLYPYPHSVLGGMRTEAYVRKLAARINYQGEGWYAITQLNKVLAAAHLSIYGVSPESGHTLWKIRHPLAEEIKITGYLKLLFAGLVELAQRLRHGTAKFVIFLSEHEKNAMSEAQRAGFRCEACLHDYYRFGEKCLVYSRTAGSRGVKDK